MALWRRKFLGGTALGRTSTGLLRDRPCECLGVEHVADVTHECGHGLSELAAVCIVSEQGC